MAAEMAPKDLERLRELGQEAHDLRYSPDVDRADKVRLDRDALVYQLAWDGVSASRIAHVAGIHRVLVYRIKDNYPARLQRWKAKQRTK